MGTAFFSQKDWIEVLTTDIELKRPIFYFERYKAWDIWTISIYAILTMFLFFLYKGAFWSNHFKDYLIIYTIGTHILLYLINYKSLRNFAVYLIWLLFGIVHLVAYFYLKGDSSLEMARGSAASDLRNTIILFVIFQVLRIVSLNIQHQELVSPSRGGRTDIFEERNVNALDYLLFIIYLASVAVLGTNSTKVAYLI
ncbi:MAG: hypothetical protein JWR05_251 [Mucilaginibacter sp.]|nr:hypothetical protein [Mucilaginibacter sp.]